MNRRFPSGRGLPIVLSMFALFAAGCPSNYQRTYQQELTRLEQQRQAQCEALHKYAAVVLFAVNSAEIDEAGRRELEWFLQNVPPDLQCAVEVNGYTDSTGPEANNVRLSEDRAANVKQYLISRGIRPESISAAGHGADYPVRPNETASGRRQNRRAEVRVR